MGSKGSKEASGADNVYFDIDINGEAAGRVIMEFLGVDFKFLNFF